MMALGLRTFSGVTVGLMGAAIGIHTSLTLSALALIALSALLLVRSFQVVTASCARRAAHFFFELFFFGRRLTRAFFGTFAPERRASDKPIAIACLRLVTF